MTSEDSRNATSSPESADGLSPSEWQVGTTLDLFGLAPAHANHTAPRDRKPANLMSATYGRILQGSSRSAALQSSLENRLMKLLPQDGWTTPFVTWRRKNTPALRRYCLLAVSDRPTRGSEYSFVPTPNATAFKGGRLTPRIVNGEPNPYNNYQDFCSLILGQRYPLPSYGLALMGFPKTWELQRPTSASAMQSSLTLPLLS